MRLFITLDMACINEWGLNLQEAVVFCWLNDLPRWAKSINSENQPYYMASYTKAIQDLPVITDKKNTMYRIYKSLQDKGLLDIRMYEQHPYVAISQEGKQWNERYNRTDRQFSEKIQRHVTEIRDEIDPISENYQSSLGKKSEHIDSNSIDSKGDIISFTPNTDTRAREDKNRIKWPTPVAKPGSNLPPWEEYRTDKDRAEYYEKFWYTNMNHWGIRNPEGQLPDPDNINDMTTEDLKTYLQAIKTPHFFFWCWRPSKGFKDGLREIYATLLPYSHLKIATRVQLQEYLRTLDAPDNYKQIIYELIQNFPKLEEPTIELD